MDRNVAAQYGTENWNETRWLGSWSPATGVGFYLHAGRFRRNLDIWWAQTVVFLPGGTVGVDRSWGRAIDDRGVHTGVFEMLVPEPWKTVTATFDGALEIVTPAELAAGPRGSGGFSVPAQWTLEAAAVREPWDMYHDHQQKQTWATGGHFEQHHHVVGEVTVDGVRYRVDGPGFDDHSHGIRNWTGFGSHIFFNAAFDDFGVHVVAVQDMAGSPLQLVGAIVRDGGSQDPVTDVSTPLIADLMGAPQTFVATITTASGQRLELTVEVLHFCPTCATEVHNDNINGLDWDVAGDPMFFNECIARYTTSGGQIGYGHLERSCRRSRASRDSLTVDRQGRL